jgi:hypothetical protein
MINPFLLEIQFLNGGKVTLLINIIYFCSQVYVKLHI